MNPYDLLVKEVALLIREEREKTEKSLAEIRALTSQKKATVEPTITASLGADQRTVTIEYCDANGTLRKSDVTFPCVIYRDIYSPDATYTEGDAVTFDGSLWIARSSDITEAPGKSDQWRLAVKRGKNARSEKTDTSEKADTDANEKPDTMDNDEGK